MARLMLFVRRPYVLRDAQAVHWIREQTAPLAQIATVECVDLTRLRTAGLRGAIDPQWLIEMHCRRREDAERAARDDACRDLVSDWRLLGMQPSLAIADETHTLKV